MEKLKQNNKDLIIIGDCNIADDVQVVGQCVLDNCSIGCNCKIMGSYIEKSVIGNNCVIGPFAHIRPDCYVDENVRIGNFVELKKAHIKSGTKISHLTYVGDAEIGKNCNLGCGVIFCNYDGKEKHKTTLGNNVFVGSNVNLIAPLKIEDNCFIAAGSTVTKDVTKDTFVIARSKQENKPKR